MITQTRLQELFIYCPSTGIFTPKRSRSGMPSKPFDRVPANNGYLRITIDGRQYYAHRLAWLYVHGIFPERILDHADGNRSNNAWRNLRESDASTNMVNSKVRRDSKSGLKGVKEAHWNPGKWFAKIWRKGRMVQLGTFNSKEEASAAFLAAQKETHGEFARAS